MNWNANWEMYGVALAGLALIYQMYRNIKTDNKMRFDIAEEHSEKRFKEFEKSICDNIGNLSINVNDIDDSFQQFTEHVNNRFDQVQDDMSEIKERMAFLEAANIYTMPLEPAQPNTRSLAAMEMWKRRKQKKLEKKDE